MLDVAYCFRLRGRPVSCEPYGEGHINETYLLVTDEEEWYILQKINHQVFHDVEGLMRNIAGVTRYLQRKDSDPRHVLTIVLTTEGKDYCRDADGGFWRAYVFVRDSLCLQQPRGREDIRRSGQAFGRFQRLLADYPAQSLFETIRYFHNTPERFRQLQEAVRNNRAERLEGVLQEIAFAFQRQERAGALQRLQAEGRLKTRVTHNDTKLNNVLLDAQTGKPLCVIDLDTVMPGLAAHDFGDSIRFGASTAAEDERDLDRVSMSLDLFRAYAMGFLSECGGSLNADEISTLPEGAWAMTLECGIRFLADYLNGDVYFRVHRHGHNLDRCRTQFRLVADMEAKWGQMQAIVAELAAKG